MKRLYIYVVQHKYIIDEKAFISIDRGLQAGVSLFNWRKIKTKFSLFSPYKMQRIIWILMKNIRNQYARSFFEEHHLRNTASS